MRGFAAIPMSVQLKDVDYILVPSSIYSKLAMGGTMNSAFYLIQDLLYQYTSYNESISVQSLPIYFFRT